MPQKRKKKLFVKRSCLTGKIVWAKYCATPRGAQDAYQRACRKEVRRYRDYSLTMKRRRQKLFSVIGITDSSSASSSVSSLASRSGLTPKQRAAIREIQALDRDRPPQGGEFYDHIIEEARRRNRKSSQWRENREKLFRYGKTHLKSDYKPNGRPHGGDRKSEKFRQSKLSASSKGTDNTNK